MLLLCALVVGSGSVWAAETVTFSDEFSDKDKPASYDGTSFSIAFDKGSNSKNAPQYYSNGSALRCYGGNTMEVSSSNIITKIVLSFGTGDGSNTISTSPDTYSEGTWVGSATSVTFTIGGSTGHRRISSVKVYTTSAVKLNASGFATYSADFDYTVTGATVYKMALDLSGGTLTGTAVAGVIPAGGGVLLKGTPNANVTISGTTTAATTLSGNNLHGTTKADGTTATPTAGKTLYVLSGNTFKKYTGSTFAANKAYFQTDGSSVEGHDFTMTFEGGTTEIKNVQRTTIQCENYYNLAGKRVAQPTKGLYIVNGKKVIIK